jgi:hypothetical protein
LSCFYNQRKHCSDKLTREHVVSASILKVAFGDPIRNTARTEAFGDKSLYDHEAVVKDVCAKCNNISLSPYDVAGKSLADSLENAKGSAALSLDFDVNTFGWIVKTHLNHFRVIKDGETSEPYKVKQKIKNSLIKGKKIPRELYRFLVQEWEESPEYWESESPDKLTYINYRSIRFRSQRIVLSNFRIRQLDTILMIPSDGDYKDFDKRVSSAIEEMRSSFNADYQLVDMDSVLSDKKLTITSLLKVSDIDELKVRT